MPPPNAPQTNGVAAESRRRRAAQAATENAIAATAHAREPTPDSSGAPRAERRASPAPPPSEPASRPAGGTERLRFERVPQTVQERYYNIDNRWFLENGEEAFVNRGDRLTTKSENRQIVRDLIEIARANRAEEIIVTGTENFRRTAWREAQRLGLRVEGYTPTPHDEKQLVRQMARERTAQQHERASPSPEPATERAADSADASATPAPRRGRRREAPEDAAGERDEDRPARRGERARAAKDRFYYGELLEHGAENYQWNPQEDMSYYVKIATAQGERVLWGKDLERAIRESTTRPKIGDQVGIRETGRKMVTVQEREFDTAGNLIGEKDKVTHRNDWLIEKREFFQERARIARTVRDTSVSAREAAARHPQLAGTEMVLREAELFAQNIEDPKTRADFLTLTRNGIADEIARGDPLRTKRVRTPEARAEARAGRTPPERAAEHILV